MPVSPAWLGDSKADPRTGFDTRALPDRGRWRQGNAHPTKNLTRRRGAIRVYPRRFSAAGAWLGNSRFQIPDSKWGGIRNRAADLGNRAAGLGNRAAGLGNRAAGLGNRAAGLGNRASGIWNLESGIWNPESGIRNP